MARYTGPACKLCRREGMKLYLKGERCLSDKCAYTRRPYPPGQHGHGRIKLSEYALRLREKQKVRRVYGVLEVQFHGCYGRASRSKGRTGEQMLGLLERRLDNLVFRMGFAASRADARQLVRHGHVLVNGRRVNIPTFVAKVGDKVSLREQARKLGRVAAASACAEKRPTLSWIEVSKEEFTGTLKGLPVREELNEPEINEQLVVEYYSR
ncbi:MAG: 30S ribosomal protein S4 [Deltaproteobacteria bacterium]|nr:30S ribosomal protein S4 [Deltaproteobacteria bacterium]